MDNKHGFGKLVAIFVAVSFATVLGFAGPNVVVAAEQGKGKLPDTKMAPADQKTDTIDTKGKKNHEAIGKDTNPLEMMDKGAKTFMEGFELAHTKKDKANGQKMMLEGHKTMANCESIWAKKEKEFTGPKKSIHDGHAMMMRGFSMMKHEKDEPEGAKMIQEGQNKVTEGLKALQTTTTDKTKDKM